LIELASSVISLSNPGTSASRSASWRSANQSRSDEGAESARQDGEAGLVDGPEVLICGRGVWQRLGQQEGAGLPY
jgi:hypothetical protein